MTPHYSPKVGLAAAKRSVLLCGPETRVLIGDLQGFWIFEHRCLCGTDRMSVIQTLEDTGYQDSTVRRDGCEMFGTRPENHRPVLRCLPNQVMVGGWVKMVSRWYNRNV